jgi:hypothetical protein
MTKKFRLSKDQIKPLAKGYGGCIASDKITVDGYLVRFMYREAPDHDADSGWRFMSGYEDDAYMENPDNHAIYDVNTIANYEFRRRKRRTLAGRGTCLDPPSERLHCGPRRTAGPV